MPARTWRGPWKHSRRSDGRSCCSGVVAVGYRTSRNLPVGWSNRREIVPASAPCSRSGCWRLQLDYNTSLRVLGGRIRKPWSWLAVMPYNGPGAFGARPRRFVSPLSRARLGIFGHGQPNGDAHVIRTSLVSPVRPRQGQRLLVEILCTIDGRSKLPQELPGTRRHEPSAKWTAVKPSHDGRHARGRSNG